MNETIDRWDKRVIIEEMHYKWVEQAIMMLENIDSYKSDGYKIPTIKHMIYFTKNLNYTKLPDLYINKSFISSEKLSECEANFKHYIWTNNPNIDIGKLTSLPNIEIKLIEEFSDHPLYSYIEKLLKSEKIKTITLVKVSDISRIIISQKYGGIYTDFDYEIFDAPPIIQYMKSFNYFNSREFDFQDSFIGNAFFASSINHPIINEASKLISRNLNDTINYPKYIKYPKTPSDELFMKTGPVVMTIAFFSQNNKNDNIDMLFPAAVFYNAKKVNPNIGLSVSDEFYGIKLKTIGADMFSGNWNEDQEFNETYDTSKNLYNEQLTKRIAEEIDKIYVINLDDTSARWSSVSHSLDKLDIDYHRYQAINFMNIKVIDQKSNIEFMGSELKNNQSLLEYYNQYSIICNPNDQEKFTFNFVHIPVDYQYNIKYLGIMCSNFMIAKEIIDNAYKNIIIFEDDIVIKPNNFKEKLFNYISHLPPNFDLAYLGVYSDKGEQEKVNDYVNKFKPEANFFCRMGLIMSYKGASQFLANDPYWGSLDHYIRAKASYTKIPNTDKFALEVYVSPEMQDIISVNGALNELSISNETL